MPEENPLHPYETPDSALEVPKSRAIELLEEAHREGYELLADRYPEVLSDIESLMGISSDLNLGQVRAKVNKINTKYGFKKVAGPKTLGICSFKLTIKKGKSITEKNLVVTLKDEDTVYLSF